ncbi:MAG: DUF6941 family protein [Chloroflexota bacterium]
MITISFAVLADCANVSREGKLNILGIFNRIFASTLPFVHPQMHLVTTFEADRADAERDHQVRVDLIDADGIRLFSIEGDLKFGSPPPGEQVSVNQVIQLNNLKFDHFGNYDFKILVNREVRKSFPLIVSEVPRVQPQ